MILAVVEKNSVYRESLVTVLEQMKGFHVGVQSGDVRTIAVFLAVQRCDLLLLDTKTGDDERRTITGLLQRRNPGAPVILLAESDESVLPAAFMNGLAAEVIFKNAGKQVIEETIRAVLGRFRPASA